MKKLTLAYMLAIATLSGVALAAQGKPIASADRARNIRFDIAILDEGGGVPPVTRNVSLIVGTTRHGSSRSLVRVPVDSRDVSNPLIATLRSRLNELERDRGRLGDRYGERHPEYQKALTQIDDLKRQLALETTKASARSAEYKDAPPMMPLHVDVGAPGKGVVLTPDGKISAQVAVEYQPYSPGMAVQPGSVHALADAYFDSGRRMVIAQTADALTERRTTIEVTATILK